MMNNLTNSTDEGNLGQSTMASLAALRREDRKAAFLLAFRELCNISVAAEIVGIDRGTVYNWLNADPEFKESFEKAREVGTELLEDVAWKRAQDTSDRLLVVLLKAYKPEKFGDKIEVTSTKKIKLDWPEGEKEENE